MKNKLSILTNGIIKENPLLVLVLGTCPSLAVTTSVSNAVGMGAAATFVLVCSNFVIACLKKIIPDKVRIPCYIVVISAFVTITELVVEAFVPALYSALGIFLPLIVVNCIILGRAEMFANKNTPIDSILDGVGMGVGYTLAITAISSVRELLGSGTWFGLKVTASFIDPMLIFKMAPGGFFTLGCLMALVSYITKGKSGNKRKGGCAGCPSAAVCNHAEKEVAGK